MAERVIRILSDLHYRDHGSVLKDLGALQPLLENIDELVVAGDVIEARHPNSPPLVADIRRFFASAKPKITLLAGNHDPEISPEQDLLLANGTVWVTHGDVFWDSSAPWSKHAAEVRHHVHAERRKRSVDEQKSSLEELFAAHRAAHIRSGAHHDPTDSRLHKKLQHAAKTLFPPTQVLTMLKAWREAPKIAATWAARHRPAARFVVFGHMHYPGVWKTRPSGVIAINTGSFTRPFGAACVDVGSRTIRVRKIEQRDGKFYPGGIWREFPLAAQAQPTVSAHS